MCHVAAYARRNSAHYLKVIMTRPRKPSPSPVEIKFHPDATTDNHRFPAGVPHARAFLASLKGLTVVEIQDRLEPRTERKVFQREVRIPEGALRMIFYWGSGGTLWYLGAFVKRNDAEGKRLIRPILSRRTEIDARDSREAERSGPRSHST